MSLQSLIIDKLNEFGLKLGIIETSTNGMISSTLATYQNYEAIFKISLILRDKSLFYKFDIDESKEFISRQNSRKLAKYLHDEYDCDIVLSVVSNSFSYLKQVEENKTINNGRAFVSILVVDKYHDFELQFKSIDEIKDRLLITSKAINELLYVVMKLK